MITSCRSIPGLGLFKTIEPKSSALPKTTYSFASTPTAQTKPHQVHSHSNFLFLQSNSPKRSGRDGIMRSTSHLASGPFHEGFARRDVSCPLYLINIRRRATETRYQTRISICERRYHEGFGRIGCRQPPELLKDGSSLETIKGSPLLCAVPCSARKCPTAG